MKVIVIIKQRLDLLPAVMAVTSVVSELGHDVEIITSCSAPETKAKLAKKGINVTEVMPDFVQTCPNILSKVKFWRTFNKRTWNRINQEARDTFLWVGSADTALALGKRLLRRSYVLQLRELYDKLPIYRKCLAKYVHHANCVVAPEISRACIFRSWYGLKETPIVLPNKPTNHPRRSNLEIEDIRARDILATLGKDEKLVLYQGGIRPYSEIRFVAEAVQTMGDGWRFAAMGRGNKEYLETLKKNYPGFIYIPRISAPYHLQVTSHAYIGVVTYSHECLNFIFCAPNKTWEYAGFGLPMVCNDLPPLRSEVHKRGAGLCIDIQDSKKIASALQQIDRNYESFSQCSQHFYDSVDIRDIIQRILVKIGSSCVSR